ncbi:MAG TPA: hypothetical protein VK188_12540 [Holophaga sp.]|nr:hypothetical protein [Holophaga sp.]
MRLAACLLCALLLPLGSALPAQAPAKDKAPDAPRWEAQNKLLMEARRLILAHRCQEALDGPLADVLAFFEAKYKDEKGQIFCATTQPETLFYLLTAAKDQKKAIVLDAPWATAHYMCAYAWFELGRMHKGRPHLEKAIALSPADSMFLAELAHYHQLDKDWPRALELFRRAEEGANMASTEDRKKADLGRAKRGIGYVLVELGKLEEAAREYEACLALDPQDKRASDELNYVRGRIRDKP